VASGFRRAKRCSSRSKEDCVPDARLVREEWPSIWTSSGRSATYYPSSSEPGSTHESSLMETTDGRSSSSRATNEFSDMETSVLDHPPAPGNEMHAENSTRGSNGPRPIRYAGVRLARCG